MTAAGDRGAPAMVLLHALGEQASDWDELVPVFARSFRVVAVDLRGHGSSDWPGAYSSELMRDDVLALLDVLGLDRVVLVGHSLGGLVGYLVAAAAPARVHRLVVEDVVPPYARPRPVPDRPDGPLPFDWAVVPAFRAEADDPAMRWWPLLADITAPTLLVGGGPESPVPQDLIADVAERIPDCTLVTIPAGHYVHRSRPDDFADAVLGWSAARAS